jgi:protein-tyrosine phosphatase
LIDIHCHILPGVDDGPETVEDSLNMAKMAVKSGITTIIATPHFNQRYKIKIHLILEKIQHLNNRLRDENINLNILPGQEVAIYGEILKDIEGGNIQSLCDTQYVFIEFPLNQVPIYTEQLIFDLQMKQFLPIIVHPERNAQFMKYPNLLYRLVRNGALTQITAASLVRGFGKEPMKFCEQLIEANLTHFIASDAHNISTRGFKLKEAYNRINDLFGKQYTFLFKENAELLIRGQMIQKLMPKRIEQKKTFGIFG